MDNNKVPGFGKSDKQIADAFGMSVSDFKKVKKQIVSDMTKPKITAKVTAKPTAKAITKPTAKPTATKNPLTKSEQDFISGQKLKAKIAKKTGVYPNTAN